MEKSNLSNNQDAIQNIKYIHIHKPEYLPVGTSFLNIVDIDNVQNDSIDNIIITDLLDYYEDKYKYDIFKIIIDKLKPGGQIDIQSCDLKQFCIAVANEDIDEETAKNTLYLHNKKNIHTIYEIKELSVNNNLNIRYQNYINIFEYHIVCTK